MTRRDPWTSQPAEEKESGSAPLKLVISGIREFVRGGVLRYGKTSPDSTTNGFWLGVDQTDSKAKLHFGNATYYIYWTGSQLNIRANHLRIDDNGIRLTAGDNAANAYRITDTSGDVDQTKIYSVLDTGNHTRTYLIASGIDATTPDAHLNLKATTYDGAVHSGAATVFLSADTGTGELASNCLAFVLSDAYITLKEQSTDPAAPAANLCRLYLRDNGSGKTQLCARFATGAVQVIATQP